MNRITQVTRSDRSDVTRRDPRSAGIASLWTILSIIMLFAFVALAVDVTFVTLTGRQLSAGADSAALAAVAKVRRSQADARSAAVTFAAANLANTDAIQVDASADVTIGVYRRDDRTFTPVAADDLPNAVQVDARRVTGSLGGPMPTIFASMFGVNEVNVERTAIAMVRGDVGPGVIALDPTARCSLSMNGSSGTFTVEGGIVQVNSSHGDAACHAGQPNLNVEEVYVVGGTDNKFEEQVDIDGELITDAEVVSDPLADLPEPNIPTDPAADFTSLNRINNGTHTLQPGLYDDLRINGGNVTFLPGLYYFTGELRHDGGNVDATAGVMLFFGPSGSLNIEGNGTFQIEGMSPTVYPEGPPVPASVANIKVPIFQSRSNTSTAEINGTSNWQMGGTIYIPNGEMQIRGTPGTFANGLIAGFIDTRGNTDLIIDYQDQFPRLPRKVFLIE